MKWPGEQSKRAAFAVALMSAGTTLVGVWIFAYRSDHAHLGDGPVPFSSVLTAGLLLVVLPISFTAYLVMRTNRVMLMPVGVVSVAEGVVISTGTPGNLFGMDFVLFVVVGVACLVIVALAAQRAFQRRLR